MLINHVFSLLTVVSAITIVIAGVYPIKYSTVSQKSTLVWDGAAINAEFAVDDDLTTASHTKCAWNTDLWYKMKFDAVYCFSDVVIIQSHWDKWASRMDDTEVFVANSDTGDESLCGVLKVSDVLTIEGQTYRIPCDLKCGDEVKLAVRHDNGDYDKAACIHMKEVKAFHEGTFIM